MSTTKDFKFPPPSSYMIAANLLNKGVTTQMISERYEKLRDERIIMAEKEYKASVDLKKIQAQLALLDSLLTESENLLSCARDMIAMQ